jgi:hypothetical protein
MAGFHPDAASSTMVGDGVGDKGFAVDFNQISEEQGIVG